jgi:stress-induced morphogen
VLTDLAGDGDHWTRRASSRPPSRGLNRVQASISWSTSALADVLGGTLHALALETAAPAE